MRKIVIAGGRDYTDKERMRTVLNAEWRQNGPFEVVSGMARGADRLAYTIAHKAGIKVHEMPADWEAHGKSAGYKRNVEMAEIADKVIAFWDGQSKGTKHMIDIAQERGIELQIERY